MRPNGALESIRGLPKLHYAVWYAPKRSFEPSFLIHRSTNAEMYGEFEQKAHCSEFPKLNQLKGNQDEKSVFSRVYVFRICPFGDWV